MKINKWFVVVLGVLMIFGLLTLLLTAAPGLRTWLDDALYDNYDPYLTCEQMPTKAEYDAIFSQHESDAAAIMRLSPNIRVDRQLKVCNGEEHAIVTIFYASHAERLQIEDLLGGKEFYGLPAIWRNW